MKKKLIALLLLLVIAVSSTFALSSCGGEDDGKLHITFYHTMGENLRVVLNKYIAQFEALYPQYKIDHKQIGGYDDVRDQISTEITVGNQPNIAYCYPDHVALYNLAYAVKTLDEFIDSKEPVRFNDDGTVAEILGLTDEQKADFIQGYYEEGRQFGDGLMYTLPLSKSTEVLYYNKTFFDICQKIYTSDIELDANGKPVYVTDDKGEFVLDENGEKQTKPNPDKGNEIYNIYPPKTWDEMEIMCQRIIAVETARLTPAQIEKGEKANVIPLGYDSEANWFITMCEQLGSDYTSADPDSEKFLFDNETNRNFVAKFREWYLKGYVTTQEIHGSYTSSLFTAKTGTKSYMSIGSSAGATHQRPSVGADGKYPFEVGITSIPQIDVENPKVISQGPSLCIFDGNAEEVKASWLFVKFLTTNVGFQADFSIASGYVPVIKSVANDEIYSEFLGNADGGDNIAALSVKVCLEQEKAYYVSPAFNGSSVARDQVGALMQTCLLIGKDVADVPGAIKKAFEDAIDECKYQAD